MNDLSPIAITNLPEIDSAQLPTVYEAAVHALEVCVDMDECMDWADRAAALASYAKQAGDDTLLRLARRIQGRAVRRCGELLQQIEPGKGGRPPTETRDAAGPSLATEFVTAGFEHVEGIYAAGRAAKLSTRQIKTSLRVARVPDEEFERCVESDDPPTMSQLAELGTQHKPPQLNGRSPDEFQQATHLLGIFTSISRDRQRLDLALAARGLDDAERERVRSSIVDVRVWLYDIEEALDV